MTTAAGRPEQGKEVIHTLRKRYDVVPHGTNWRVTHAGQTLSSHVLKPPAIESGVKVARANQPSQLIIHRADGTIEDERTYGNDPYPPRG
jgi:hypothetical protein